MTSISFSYRQIGQRKRRRPRFTASFRLLWAVLSKSLDKWEDLVHLMQPATVKKWHTTTFRYFWQWKSRRKGGRPPISKEMQNLIYKLSKENPLWSAERIRDTLLLLNQANLFLFPFSEVCITSISA